MQSEYSKVSVLEMLPTTARAINVQRDAAIKLGILALLAVHAANVAYWLLNAEILTNQRALVEWVVLLTWDVVDYGFSALIPASSAFMASAFVFIAPVLIFNAHRSKTGFGSHGLKCDWFQSAFAISALITSLTMAAGAAISLDMATYENQWFAAGAMWDMAYIDLFAAILFVGAALLTQLEQDRRSSALCRETLQISTYLIGSLAYLIHYAL